MLHTSTVDSNTISVLKELLALPILKDFTLKDLPTIVHLITSSDERKQIAGVMGLRKILSIGQKKKKFN